MTRTRTIIALAVVVLLAGGFFLLRASSTSFAPIQPVQFDHWQHVSSTEGPTLECGFCHEHADKNAHATVPNVELCMVCHSSIKTESAEVQKLAAFAERSEQPPWRRVYWFEQDADVFFTHKPHLRAGIECSSCHGEVGQAHRVRREVDQTMGWCIDCHRSRNASVDCYTCHR
ncbi:MAG TPA: cytochrome c3 family protein [Blastocatellia bacterium]|nr:cytochrome c3 family protein [Blastocatellia bacterium]